MKLTMKQMLLGGFIAVACLVVFAGIFGVIMNGKLAKAGNEIAQQMVPVQTAAMNAQINVERMQKLLKEYLATRIDLPQYEAAVLDAMADIEVWTNMIAFGTDSQEFLNSEAGKDYQKMGLTIQIEQVPEQIAQKAQEAMAQDEELNKVFQEIQDFQRKKVNYTAFTDQGAYDMNAFIPIVRMQHVDWVAALKDAANIGTTFTGQTDHTKCFMGRWLQGYSTDDEILNALLDDFKKYHEKLHNLANDVNAAETVEKKQKLLNRGFSTIVRIEGLFVKLQEYIDQVYNDLDARQEQSEQKLDGVVEKLNVVYGELVGQVQDAMNSAVLEAAGVSRTAKMSLIAMMIVAVVLALLLGLWITALIFKQLGADPSKLSGIAERIAMGESEFEWGNKKRVGVYAAMQKMAEVLTQKSNLAGVIANGDLSKDVDLASEKDALGNALRQMLASLNDLMGQISQAAEQVNSGSDQISSASQSLSQGATESAASLEEITSSMTEIGSQTKQNAENAQQANHLATEARQAAEKGNETMTQMVGAMGEINESSQQISKIIKTIDDIAFQTNLLALNAAVEAARAGQHGKGFAVVAEEVRNLAGRSAKAAKETADLIELSNKRTENGMQIAEHTAKALTAIVQGVSKAADLVGEIAAASNEQAQGIQQVSQGLSQIDSVTQQNTANAEQTAAAAQELSSQAKKLQELIGMFRLKNQQRAASLSAKEKSASLPKPKAALPKVSAHSKDVKKDQPDVEIKLDDDEFGKY